MKKREKTPEEQRRELEECQARGRKQQIDYENTLRARHGYLPEWAGKY